MSPREARDFRAESCCCCLGRLFEAPIEELLEAIIREFRFGAALKLSKVGSIFARLQVSRTRIKEKGEEVTCRWLPIRSPFYSARLRRMAPEKSAAILCRCLCTQRCARDSNRGSGRPLCGPKCERDYLSDAITWSCSSLSSSSLILEPCRVGASG